MDFISKPSLTRCGFSPVLPSTRKRSHVTVFAELKKTEITRRKILKTMKAALGLIVSWTVFPVASMEDQEINYRGNFQPMKLPKLEHTCTACFPLCVGDGCLIRIQVMYPKAVQDGSISARYPVAILSSGFLIGGEDYASYAERLASRGYVAILYDKVETLMEYLDDVVSSILVRDIIDWTQTNPLMQKIADNSSVYLIGHSRGGKVSVLTALMDPRVKSLCLIDPVDNTVYAPVGPGYPSAVEGIKEKQLSIPMLIIGSELGSDCAPVEANYNQFYNAAVGPAMEVIIQDCGHFQFLDNQNGLAKSVCLRGHKEDEEVRAITQSLMVSWGEATVKMDAEANVPAKRSTAPMASLPINSFSNVVVKQNFNRQM